MFAVMDGTSRSCCSSVAFAVCESSGVRASQDVPAAEALFMALAPAFEGCVVPHPESGAAAVLCVTRRKLQTPGNAEEHKRQETPTINPIGPTNKPHRPSTKHYRKDSPGDA